MRVVIVGEAPNAGSIDDPADVLSGAIGKRLAGWAGVELDEYLSRTVRVNLFDTARRHWSAPNARRFATVIGDELQTGDLVILLGARVAEAFGLGHLPWFAWHNASPGISIVCIPHPSGRNRVYNEPRYRVLAQAVMSEALRAVR